MTTQPTTNWVDRLRDEIRKDPGFMLEDLFERYPEVANDSVQAAELIYEEHCILREIGIEQSVDEVLVRFPKWTSKLEVLFACDAVLEQEDESIEFPRGGEAFGDFQLIRELGRGARGRVYLARQPSLSDRAVVLKLAAISGDEHLSLARLQHSAIVPLLFALEDAATKIRTLCMPFLGDCTLAKTMDSMSGKAVEQRRGLDFADAIEHLDEYEHRDSVEQHDEFKQGVENAIAAPAIRFLGSATYEQAVCWIISCLAEGVECAHRRGLVHLDIKPSNVLLASDGQPMLLDFHLAREIRALSKGTSSIGGTPGYMAPEHLKAIDAISNGNVCEIAIDQRSDIYSLGLVMRDLLVGAPAPTALSRDESPRRDLLRTDRSLAHVSTTVRRILDKCLAEDREHRYPTAAELASQLRRVVQPEPKSRSSTVFVAFFAGIAIGAGLLTLSGVLQNDPDPATAPTKPLPAAPVIFDELHRFLTQARGGQILENASPEDLETAKQTCAKLWTQRERILASIDVTRDRAIVRRLANDLQDLAVLSCELIERTETESHEKVAQIRSEAKSLQQQLPIGSVRRTSLDEDPK